MSGSKTPVMQQHAAAKRAYPDAIVFFRLGDFYEMFGEDAQLTSRLLDLTLTSRNKGKPEEIPMAGVPYHAAHGYIAKLLELGHKVAICEQMADPSKVKGIVPREVVRVITPGLLTDADYLNAHTNNYLAAVEFEPGASALALFDLSTGELSAAVLADATLLLSALSRSRPREILLGFGKASDEERQTLLRALQALGAPLREDDALEAESVDEVLGDLQEEARRVGASGERAVARAMRFARRCNPGQTLPVTRVARFEPSENLAIDSTAQQHLELVESPAGRKATLLNVIDATRTPSGARLLRRRLLAPLLDVERIRRRLDAVEVFLARPTLREQFGEVLSAVGDLERLAVRASLGEATPRDLGALRDGLAAAAAAVESLQALDAREKEVLRLIAPGSGDSGACEVDVVPELQAELARALVDRPPALAKEGSVFRSGFDSELDELDDLQKRGAEKMVELEARLRQDTGVASLKVRYTRVFGWYIEVTRSQAAKVPEGFRRKQTVASGERYTTPELDELSDRILHAEERHRDRELDLLKQLVALAGRHSERVRALAARIARWDVAQGLAEIAHRHEYTRPVVDESDVITIREGRHAVVERLAEVGRFVPNDVDLASSGARLWLITGPNMAGKSTFLRQVALITLLAQMGSFVPARSARIGVVDRILSRVGASDNLSRGESTFMVEMRETAEILRSATRRSLVILDEIGRGTSTFDGLSIAWAVAEYLDEAIGCRALFATHYHELTGLAEASTHTVNYSVSAKEVGHDVVFLHRVGKGPASRSYGVAVAKLAGLPESVLSRARALLAMLEKDRRIDVGARRSPKSVPENQLGLFGANKQSEAKEREVLETLRNLDPDRLTGLEALQLLARLKTRL
ncbi:MAG TPA: DNA mismatch repair protein MutS [Polyangiaceae bacterium]|nr:DNA mismatch repair protein MutS [Polyangiaceae bacterium]